MKTFQLEYILKKACISGTLVLLVGLMGGCAVWEFTETRYENAIGYFNTYYNAKTLYDEAMEEIDELSVPDLETAPKQNATQQFGKSVRMAQVGGAAGEMYQNADAGMAMADGTVQAASDGASMHTDGAVIDNATAGIFTSPFGNQSAETTRAMQLATRRANMKEFGMTSSVVSKLDRVIEKCSRLLVQYPKSKWVDNSLLMIGVSFFYKSDLIKSERKFKELLESFPDSDLEAEALMWLGRVYDRMDKTDDAEQLYREAIELALKNEDPNVVADAYYSLGEMYLTTGREELAIGAYTEGTQYTSSKAKRIKLELALAKEHEYMGNMDKAQDAYAHIIQLDPDIELLFKAELNYARISRLRGDIEEAINTLADMLDEPAYIQFDGPLQLEIGHLYEDAEEYEAAVDQYTYVDTTFAKTVVSCQAGYALGKLYDERLLNYDKAFDAYTRSKLSYPGIAEADYSSFRALQFEQYFKARTNLAHMDTLLFFVLHPDSLASRDKQQAIRDSLDREKKIAEGWDPNEKTEEQRMIERLARRRPHGRNTGRVNPWQQELDKLTGKTTNVPMINGTPVGTSTPKAVTAHLPDYRRLPIRALSADSILQQLSIQRFEMGWIMFDNIKNLDSAIFYYDFALEGNLPDSIEAQAYYTLTEIYRKRNNDEMVKFYEDILVQKHYRSRFTAPILLARGMDIPKDSATVAREAYDRAAAILERGDYRDGIKALRQMSENYSYSDQVPRAYLAMAMTYETNLNEGEKALEIYKMMMDKYPTSLYTARARQVLGAIEKAKNAPPPVEKVVRDTLQNQKARELKPKKPTISPRERFEQMRDSVMTGQKKLHDPSEDRDFPLSIPGEETKVKRADPVRPSSHTPPQSVPGSSELQGTGENGTSSSETTPSSSSNTPENSSNSESSSNQTDPNQPPPAPEEPPE